MRSKKLNEAIKNTLQSDAKAFVKTPSERVYQNIISEIKHQPQKVLIPSVKNTVFDKLSWVFTVSAVSALMVFLYIKQESFVENNHMQQITNRTQVDFNVAGIIDQFESGKLPELIESQLTNDMMFEQEALIKDFNYLKNIFDVKQFKKG